MPFVRKRLRSSARTPPRLPHAGLAEIKLDQSAPSHIEKNSRGLVTLPPRFLAQYRYRP
jgi:hypothetical protein